MHLVREHGAVEGQGAAVPPAQTLPGVLAKASARADQKVRQVALAYAWNPGLAFSLLEDKWFQAAFGTACSKAACPAALFTIQAELVKAIKEQYQGSQLLRNLPVASVLPSQDRKFPLHWTAGLRGGIKNI